MEAQEHLPKTPWATLSRKFLLCTGLGEPCSIFASIHCFDCWENVIWG